MCKIASFLQYRQTKDNEQRPKGYLVVWHSFKADKEEEKEFSEKTQTDCVTVI